MPCVVRCLLLLLLPASLIAGPQPGLTPAGPGLFPISGETAVYLAGVAQAFFILPLIVTSRSDRPLSKYLFATLVLVIGLSFAESVFYSIPALYRNFPHGVGLLYPLGSLLAPLLYLYVKSHLYPGFKLGYFQLLHLIPFFLTYLLLLKLFQLPAEAKLMMIEQEAPAELFSIDLEDILEMLQMLGYLAGSFFLTLRFNQKLKHQYSYQERINARWLLFLIGLMTLLAVAYLFTDMIRFLNEQLFAVMFVSSIYFLGYMAMRHRHAFDGIRLDQPPTTGLTAPGTEAVEVSKTYATEINPDEKERIRLGLNRLLESEQMFLDSYLNLDKLAGKLSAHPNNVSRTINEAFRKSFFELINGYRIAYCKTLLAQQPYKSVLEVAYASGFNSKSAFYSAFKNETGLTPVQYRKQLASATS